MNSKIKTSIFILVFLATGLTCGLSQKRLSFNKAQKQLLKSALNETSPYSYRVSSEMFNTDIYGNAVNSIKTLGSYTRGLNGNKVQWNNISVSIKDKKDKAYAKPAIQEYFNNFEYVPSEKMITADAFPNLQLTHESILARNLVWDMINIESFAWGYIDSLSLNKTQQISPSKNAVNIASMGTFIPGKQEITLIGFTKINKQNCAIIEFRAYDNKMEMDMPSMKSKGSEQHWGKIWISLKTKQIEYAEMYSIASQEMEIGQIAEKVLLNSTRKITVEKSIN